LEKRKNLAKIRILIADDHPPFREGLSKLLEQESDMEVVGMPADGEEAVAQATLLKPDVVLIDVAMPKLNGIEAVKKIKDSRPDTAVLMISAYGYEPYLIASMQAGATGYLLKSSAIREVISAIRSVYNGQAVFDLKAAGKILDLLAVYQGKETAGAQHLHARELQILRLAAKGISNKEIGTELKISDRTVQTHLIRIFRKLGVNSRTEAVLHALKVGWLSMEDLP
jgi:two-component system, NarL family, response regulator LiaR